jgi:NAD(P)-dependent dehydrogenase (short-subunit alcohol dehydrogenase family)
MISLTDKNILIVGGYSGIGRECAVIFAKIGAKVVIVGRDEKKLNQTLSLLDGHGHLSYVMDVTELENLDSLVSDCVSKIGKLDGFVYSAGVELTMTLQGMSYSKYIEMFSINTIAAFEFSKIISKKKFYNNSGASFVFISSITGLLGVSGKTGYCSSKGALITGAKAIALELANKKIRVNSILPGIVDTEMFQKIKNELSEESLSDIQRRHPLGIGKPEDVGNLCAFLLSDLSNWITGSDYIIDGGYSCQ